MNTFIKKIKHLPIQSSFIVSGGIIMIIGIFLPWITMFGGLQTFTGLAGVNGKILLTSASLSVLGGVLLFFKKSTLLFKIIGIVGALQVLFSSYLLVNLFQTVQRLSTSMNSMVAITWGPGLFVTTLGSLLIASSFVHSLANSDLFLRVLRKALPQHSALRPT